MENTVEVQDDFSLAPEEEQFEDYVFGDLFVKCSCGNDSLEIAGIEGLQITMPATSRDQICLVCPSCKHEIKLYFRRAENVLELMEKRDKILAAIEEEKEKVKQFLSETADNAVEVDAEEENTEE